MQWWSLDHQIQGGHGCRSRQQSQSSNQESLTLADLWCRLVDHGVPRSEIDGKPTEFLLDLDKQKSSRSSKHKSNLNDKSSHDPSINSQT